MPLILVADDDFHQLEMRRALLEASGHQVLTALSTGEVIRHLASASPDLVVMDLRFPDVHGEPDSNQGLALIRELRERYPKLPLVVMSGWPQELEGRPEEGMVARVIPKPARMTVLLDAIRQLVPLVLSLAVLGGGLRAETRRFVVRKAAEVVADLEMSSPGSDWSKAGREAALADLRVDGSAPQHVMLFAGEA